MLWLVLTLLTSGAFISWCLQQQYEEKSARFRILYRDITVKLSQHDAIIPLLPDRPDTQEVQKILPQIVLWRRHNFLEPRSPIVAEPDGRYWLNLHNLSLLIDLKVLLNDLPENKHFPHLSLRWNSTLLYEAGQGKRSDFWHWDKVISSPSQPFVLSVSDNPDWAQLPRQVIILSALIWALILYLVRQYQINKRRRDIADLRASYSELARLNTMGEMAAGIVHELNQPLTAVMSYNQAAVRLIKQNNVGALPPLLDASVVQIKRIDALLNQFRQKLGREQAEFQAVDIRALWPRVMTLLDNEISQHKITLSSNIAADLAVLHAPSLWVEQILHNILSNAIQAQANNANGGWVHLDATSDACGMTLVVSDGGPGFSHEALSQAFMPFFTTREQGIGLGMTLVETLVQRLNGHISVENSAGAGARIVLWFPLCEQEA